MFQRLIVGLFVLLAWVASASAQGLSPDDAVKRMKVADGFAVSLVAAEPLIRQPVAIEFDDRGRLWVIQYLQYPNPEGLKRVTVDRYSRTKYDRVPEPPPKGPRGADRITILENSDGDGRMDRSKDFVNGLNLTTGIAFGHGGVFVLNVPYLLFYPDRDRDDVPDADPDVLLTGFGMEDAHSVANSLTIGPDGWLYGCQGSTVTANIRGIEFQQGVWRYHPVTREFELFCEGGGNSWGLDFDRDGHLLYSTNWGGHVLLHGVPGAYLIKSFGKHGALHNPHAYGYFEHAPHRGFKGGHVTVGGVVYQGGLFPESFRGKYIAGDLLGHGVYWHDIRPNGSTVQTAHGGELLVANDPWFAPTDVTTGPDGAIYVTDWHDARTAHPDPDADWDRSNGRIYRIAPVVAESLRDSDSKRVSRVTRPSAAAQSVPLKRDSNGNRANENSGSRSDSTTKIDFARLSADDLLKLHDHPNQWQVRRARQELVRRFSETNRSAESLLIQLRDRALAADPNKYDTAREALWTLHCLSGLDEALAFKLLESPHEAVRFWTLRFLGDPKKAVSTEMAHRLDDLAETEPSVRVRQQVACTAARLPANQAMPMINANINRDIDNNDPYQPLLWWWAVERLSVSQQDGVNGRDEVLKRFVRPSLWKSQLGSRTLLPRLVRRYASEGTSAGFESVVKLLKAAPNDDERDNLLASVLIGLNESPTPISQNDKADPGRGEFKTVAVTRWEAKRDNSTLLSLAITLRHAAAIEHAWRQIGSPQTDASRRASLLGVVAETIDSSSVERLLVLIAPTEPLAVRSAALTALSRLDDERITAALLAQLRESDPGKPASVAWASQIHNAMLGRKGSAKSLLAAVDRGDLKPASIALDAVRRVALLETPELDGLVTKHWGKLGAATREEKLAEVRRLNNDLRAAGGNAEVGKAIFKKQCATCHTLHGEGAKIGPDLTTANRKDRDFLLISLVDPSVTIRKEFVSHIIETKDGRVLTGLITARADGRLTLVNTKAEKTEVAEGDIEALRESPISLMPDDQYRQLKPQELRDLFAYLSKE